MALSTGFELLFTGWINDAPEFAEISKIVVVGSREVYFVLRKYVSRQFTTHYHAFEVCKPQRECSIVLQQSKFKHYMPAHEVKLSNAADGVVYIAP